MSPLRITYLVLTVIGTLWPMSYFIAYGAEFGWSLGSLIEAWRVNDATKGLTADLFLTAFALSIWIIAEVRVRKNWIALAAIPATFIIGLSCGLPLYLFLRTRKIS